MSVVALRPVVECRDVVRTFGNGARAVAAVRAATCTVLPGDRVAVTGRSGSGKSTLLHLLAGLDLPTSGTVEWPALGAITGLRPTRVAMVFQSQSLVAPLDVVENVALPLLLSGCAEGEARRRAVESLRTLALDELAERLPEELSGGQAQRVAVARVLALEPQLVLADEPTGQLDHATAAQLLDVLFHACDRIGAALVVSTHDERVAQRLATRWSMADGLLTVAG